MTVAVNTLVGQAGILLSDTLAVRWAASELIGWLNDGQKEIAIIAPEAVTVTANLLMTANSARQELPASAISLVDVTFDLTKGESISRADKSVLDQNNPFWQSGDDPMDGGVRHFIADPRNPRRYVVYPRIPAGQTRYLEVTYVDTPSIVSAGGNISVPDVYAPALLNYMVAKALAKDAETGSPQLATAYYQAFLTLASNRGMFNVGSEPATQTAFNPNLAP